MMESAIDVAARTVSVKWILPNPLRIHGIIHLSLASSATSEVLPEFGQLQTLS